MSPRPPMTLWRYLAGDLLRILAIAGGALVIVISLAGAVRPLADGQIGAFDALRLAALLSVPMMQFALPFAASFAATLAYHRFAADNESIAASVGTVGYASMLAPAFAVGLALTLALGVLTNEVIPRFLQRAERLVQSDLASVLVAPIERGRAIQFGDMHVHADRAVGPLETEGGPAGAQHIALYGVLAVRDDGESDPSYYSAERVDLWIFDDPDSPDGASVVLQSTGSSTNDARGGFENETFTTKKIRIPRSFTDDPKFMTLAELRELPNRPRTVAAIDRRAARLERELERQRLVDAVRGELAATGRATFLGGDETTLGISGARLEQIDAESWAILPEAEGATLTVSVRSPGVGDRALWAEEARLRSAAPERRADVRLAGPPTATLELVRVTAANPSSPEAAGLQAQQVWAGLTLRSYEPSERGAPLDQLIAEANAVVAREADLAASIESALSTTTRRYGQLEREIVSKLNERAAFSTACLVMVCSGAVIALLLRDMLPLQVYLWSFFPALGSIVAITSGERTTFRYGSPGLLLLWGGVALLALYTLMAFSRLRRH